MILNIILKVIPKNKYLTSSTILYFPKNKIREFTHHEQTPLDV